MERMDCSHPVFERHPTLCAVGNRRTARVVATVQPQDQTSHHPRLLGTGTSSAELLLGDGVGRRRSSRNNKVAFTDACIYPRSTCAHTGFLSCSPGPAYGDRSPQCSVTCPKRTYTVNIHSCSRYLCRHLHHSQTIVSQYCSQKPPYLSKEYTEAATPLGFYENPLH